VVAPGLTRRLLSTFTRSLPTGSDQAAGDPRLRSLTDREREVLLDMAGGLTNGEIAQHLHLSESTIKTHVGRVLAKIGARDRVHAVIIAYEVGLVGPGG